MVGWAWIVAATSSTVADISTGERCFPGELAHPWADGMHTHDGALAVGDDLHEADELADRVGPCRRRHREPERLQRLLRRARGDRGSGTRRR